MSSIRSFIPLQKLGQGTYSNVYKVRRIDDNQIYALKKVKLASLTQKQKQNALNEVRILASIQSPYIVGYKQAFFDQSLSVLCIVMEFADDGDLQKYIKTNTKNFKLIQQDEIWKAAQHILKGLQNLHSKGILHRDIKCANIFKSKGAYKLGDLNVSKVNGDKLAYTQTGTPYYASPEVWRDQPYDHKSDIWSFGCIIYQMAALKPPFNGKDMEDLFKNVQKGKITPLTAHYSNDLWSFIELCLQKDPKKRPSASQLLKILIKHNQNILSGLKISNPQSNKLLKTIKVPHDLKKLNQALPTSKYRKNNQSQKYNSNKIIDEKKSQKQIKQNKVLILYPEDIKIRQKKQKKQSQSREKQNQQRLNLKQSNVLKNKSIINKSSICLDNQRETSPKNRIIEMISSNSYRSPKNRTQLNKNIMKSPISQVRLSKKVENSLGSQRLQKSDRKSSTASKVQQLKRKIDIQMNLKNITQNLKKPTSIPRTQKKPTIINNSHLIQCSYNDSILQQNPRSHIKDSQSSRVDKNISQVLSSGKYNSNHLNDRKNYVPQEPMNHKIIEIRENNKYQKYEALDNWKNKLLKKNRILSNNYMMKPSWW